MVPLPGSFETFGLGLVAEVLSEAKAGDIFARLVLQQEAVLLLAAQVFRELVAHGPDLHVFFDACIYICRADVITRTDLARNETALRVKEPVVGFVRSFSA